ncbi:DUF427 domain-containing protein [Haloactinomyces albus]|uniref:Uncharacterized protein (DUF427 family) n=1 Tax=Haloactinomyces albus TaxID=1352928 RepID=A0AAE3ZEQ9_9ACTN|nr:DUF427 domain-containing protein [Haloactinomyces albus]MDR7302288.1 uncharacterized protein (DUF427 family) [Haloactinomyces albus]
MALTLGGGPLAARPPDTVNYHIDGPAHRLLWHDFPRRIRALFGGEVVVDSDDAKLLHESNLLPQVYVPFADVAEKLLESTSHHTHCPFKGDASYCSVRVGDRVAENAVWSYPSPTSDASWLAGHLAVYWTSMDAWFDEDEEVFGHIRDPYHRVDVRPTSRLVQVVAGETTVAESRRAKVLSETGLPNRYYVPADEVRLDLLEPSATHTVCPYKGTASYRSLHRSPGGADGVITDAAWSYPNPLDDARAVAGHFCFVADGVETRVDGAAVP